MNLLSAQRVALQSGRIFAVLLFGLVLPSLLLFEANSAMGRMSELQEDKNDIGSVVASLPTSVSQLHTNNDYAILTVAILEASNQRTMLVKQRMKMSVMHIGFAVISLGMMMILLGIEAGGVEASAGIPSGATLDIKTASAGVAAVLLGAILAAAGALVPNSYSTVSVPAYAATKQGSAADVRLEALHRLSETCRRDASGPSLAPCLYNAIATSLATK